MLLNVYIFLEKYLLCYIFIMYTTDDLRKYEKYLEVIDAQLKEFFTEQSPYVFCKEGCCECCQVGEYQISKLEFMYLNIGMTTLSVVDLEEINAKFKQLKLDKASHNSEEPFTYTCPFLKDNRCSLYNFRGLICRAHGLAYFTKSGKLFVPECVHSGLNYSNVYDFEAKQISQEKYDATGFEQEPLAHNLGLHFLTSNSLTEELALDFGEIKPMVDWF